VKKYIDYLYENERYEEEKYKGAIKKVLAHNFFSQTLKNERNNLFLLFSLRGEEYSKFISEKIVNSRTNNNNKKIKQTKQNKNIIHKVSSKSNYKTPKSAIFFTEPQNFQQNGPTRI